MKSVLLPVIALFSSLLVPFVGQAECRDRDAFAASDDRAKAFFRNAEIFHPAKILKVHHPSRRKEVASYVKSGNKRYSIFNLVDEECKVFYRKRTRQGD